MNQTNTPATSQDPRLQEALQYATDTAQNELGTADNKSATAKVTLEVSSTENGVTNGKTFSAAVTLGVTTTPAPAVAAA